MERFPQEEASSMARRVGAVLFGACFFLLGADAVYAMAQASPDAGICAYGNPDVCTAPAPSSTDTVVEESLAAAAGLSLISGLTAYYVDARAGADK